MKNNLKTLFLFCLVNCFHMAVYAQPALYTGISDNTTKLTNLVLFFIVLVVAIGGFWFYKTKQRKRKPKRSQY